MGDNEEYFPRGGKKPTTLRFKQSSNFLGGVTQEESKKKKSKKTLENDDGYLSDELVTEVDTSYKSCGLWLNYKVIREGLLMLGRVRDVMDTKVYISLPCRMSGIVMACHISETYNKQLEAYVNDQTDKVSELTVMFRRGQYVAVKVLEVASDHLMLSMMPQHINYGKMHSALKKGTLLQAAMISEEDHGYLMDIGVSNTKVFMPKKSVNPELQLDSGGLCWVVIKSVSSSDSCVVSVSGALSDLQRAVQHSPSMSLLPATALEFTVDKPLDNGIEGHITDDVTAYIQRHHVDMVRGKKPALGQKIRARLLYTIPPKNIPFLTMKGIFDRTYPDLGEEQKLNIGDIVEEAQVIKIMGRSVYLKLGDSGLALLSLRRIQVDEDLTDEDIVAKSYPVGSILTVRVLCYNLSDYMYSVSDEPAVLAERYFTLSHVAVGQHVTATVTEVADKHLRVTVGRLRGYIPQAHMTEGGVFVDPKKATASTLSKKKFKVGQEVKARVLHVDSAKSNLVLTLKSSLLDPALPLLTDYEQARVGRSYTGVIGHIRDFLLVSFFNNVVAYVPRRFVGAETVDSLNDAFHVGQIVKCTILSVKPDEKKMTGSLISKQDVEKSKAIKRKLDETQDKKAKKPKKGVTKEKNVGDEDKVKSKNGKKREKRNKMAIDDNNLDEDDTNAHKMPSSNKIEEKKKKKKQIKEEDIETDFKEKVLAPEDLALMDFSDCITTKNYKKRVVSLLKSVKARSMRLEKVKKKITGLEKHGINATNKKYHTAMNMEKILLEERVDKLVEALKHGQGKLKELDVELNIGDSKENEDTEKEIEKGSMEKPVQTKKNNTKNEKNKRKVDKKDTGIEVNVVDSLQPVIQVASAKAFWTDNVDDIHTPSLNNNVQDSDSSDEEEEEKPKKKRKKLSIAEKIAKAREEEERTRAMESRAVEADGQPRSCDQFSRALLDKPDASHLWIAYMTFHLQAAEIDKARAVARKAVATINFREEQERLNVWLALLNLEHRFGTKESQQKILEEALQMNDTYTVHKYLLKLLEETSKHQELVNLVDLMMRKYRLNADVYCLCGAACYKAGLLEQARRVMQKGIATLTKKEHVNLLVHFAKLERSVGERERSEALFEQVLAVYPQRVDVAAVYLDLLVKGGDVERARQAMDRLTSLALPARKMKILYKKWIEVEEKIGDATQVESVRSRAKKFLENATF